MVERKDYVGNRFGNGHHSSEEIKRQVDHTRAEMDSTIDALIDRLDPAAVLSKTIHGFLGGGSKAAGKSARVAGKAGNSLADMGENLLEKAKDNPVPTAMIALGAAWLMMGNDDDDDDNPLDDLESDPTMAEHATSSGRSTSAEIGHGVKSAASSVKHGAQDAYSATGQKAEDLAHAAQRAGKTSYRKARKGVRKSKQGYDIAMLKAPLAVGGIALGLGLLCGVLIPETEAEDEWMGSTRDDLLETGKETAREVRDRGMEAVAAAADAASESLDEEGLGPQDLKDKLSQTAESAKDAAKEDWKSSQEG
ncbi:DUF3618 domain-containing protein [Bremerella alba]|uniref:DUF3618 domain-containing protein n=1 Tax=Bremerella alba TaxID=980252 RepID=A0A7V8V4Q0_9BACT|nr:DUF3618 domain-containing protein [Bremerella alba]MBA2114654.1 hypothetical protein [Bremerella alba]